MNKQLPKQILENLITILAIIIVIAVFAFIFLILLAIVSSNPGFGYGLLTLVAFIASICWLTRDS